MACAATTRFRIGDQQRAAQIALELDRQSVQHLQFVIATERSQSKCVCIDLADQRIEFERVCLQIADGSCR